MYNFRLQKIQKENLMSFLQNIFFVLLTAVESAAGSYQHFLLVLIVS